MWIWRQLTVRTLTVHIQGIDAKLMGFDRALVMLPVAPGLVSEYCDVNFLIRDVLYDAFQAYDISERGLFLKSSGDLEFGKGRRMKSELEFGGHRFIVQACSADRPAFVVRYKPSAPKAKSKELAHMYVAQGLHRQHGLLLDLLHHIDLQIFQIRLL